MCRFEGHFTSPRAMFLCNSGRGHVGQFVYVKDERESAEYLGLCEVQVFSVPGENHILLYHTVQHGNTADPAECGYPEQGLHSSVTVAAGRARYTCDPGYSLAGEQEGDTRQCSQGSWAGPVPACLGQYKTPSTSSERL